MCRSAPAAWLASTCSPRALAETMITGVCGRPSACSRARISRVAARPSSTGICMSISTASKPPARQAATPSRPFSAQTTSMPAPPSRISRKRRLWGWSSTTRMRRACWIAAAGSVSSRTTRCWSAAAGGASSRGEQIELEGEPGPVARRADAGQLAAEQLGQFAADGQAQAAAAEAAGDRAVGLFEAVEQARPRLLVEAGAAVAHDEAERTGFARPVDGQPHGAGLGELHRVAQHVAEDLFQPDRVAFDDLVGRRVDLDLEGDALLLGPDGEQGREIG